MYLAPVNAVRARRRNKRGKHSFHQIFADIYVLTIYKKKTECNSTWKYTWNVHQHEKTEWPRFGRLSENMRTSIVSLLVCWSRTRVPFGKINDFERTASRQPRCRISRGRTEIGLSYDAFIKYRRDVSHHCVAVAAAAIHNCESNNNRNIEYLPTVTDVPAAYDNV